MRVRRARGGSGGAPGGLRGAPGGLRGGGSGVAPGEALGAARGAATPTRGPTQQGRGSDYMYSVSVSLVQQHPGVVGCCRSRVVVVEVELVVLPPIKPLGPIGPSSIVDHHGSLRDAREHPVHGRLHIVTGPHSAAKLSLVAAEVVRCCNSGRRSLSAVAAASTAEITTIGGFEEVE